MEIYARNATISAGVLLEISARPLFDSAGARCGAVAIFRNITQRKLADEERERLVSIIEATTDLVGITDADGTFVYMNAACRRIAGLGPDEDAANRRFSDLQTSQAEDTLRRVAIPTAIAQDTWSGETMFCRHDGAAFPVSTVVIAHKTAGGALQHLSTVSRDISERKAQEQKLRMYTAQLERSNRELERFASVASHDLQEPLRKIQAFGDRVTQKFAELLPETGVDYLCRMQDAARRMQILINDLLMYSRLATKERRYSRANLNAIASKVLTDLEIRIEETGGTVELGELPVIEADTVQMRQLFQNLIANALKFRRPDVAPLVSITGELLPAGKRSDTPRMCRITVSDNGIGIEEKYFERIFGIFERLHNRAAYEGTGVGLAVCRKIAEQHGGTIEVSSTPGEGTTFTILIPSERPDDDMEG
jgi:PAS domain S-box-containing protein